MCAAAAFKTKLLKKTSVLGRLATENYDTTDLLTIEKLLSLIHRLILTKAIEQLLLSLVEE